MRSNNQPVIMLACSNISNTFEYDAARIFNRLPQKYRDNSNYKDFCSETNIFLLDQAFFYFNRSICPILTQSV